MTTEESRPEQVAIGIPVPLRDPSLRRTAFGMTQKEWLVSHACILSCQSPRRPRCLEIESTCISIDIQQFSGKK